MASPINRQPAGWLSFLGLKAIAPAPSATADFVQPVLDLLPWYQSFSTVRRQFASGIVGAVGFISLGGPGAGEAWLVKAFGTMCTVPAGEAITMAAAIGCTDITGAAITPVRRGGPPQNVTAGLYSTSTIELGYPFLMTPGYVFGVVVQAGTFAGAMTVTGLADIVILDL